MDKKNSLLIISPLFKPEMNRVNDIVNYFLLKNYKVTVLCPIPNYPEGRYFNGYGIFRKRCEKNENLSIFRVLVYPRKNGSKTNLFLNYLSFIIFSLFPALILSLKKFDLVFVNQLSPITIALPGIIIKKIQRIPLIMWVTDLWPESVKEAGNLKSNLIPNMILPIVKFIYRNCDKILVSSKSFIGEVSNKVVGKDIEYMPQWSEDLFLNNDNKNFQYEPFENIKSFKILFAGNIGVSQDFETLIRAMYEIRKYDVHFVVLGNGRYKKTAIEKVKKLNLNNRISFLGSFPLETMPYFFKNSDALIISLKKSLIFSKTIPSKTQPYMCSSKPILTNADGEVSNIINEAKCGLTANSGDYIQLSKNIIKLNQLSKKDLQKMGDNARKYYLKNFSRKQILMELEEKIIKLKS
jgi:glycosyltransferase involved in cell wall biosynthesis